MSEVRLPGDLRHYLPLFFLAPSMGLLIYAWNKQPPPPPTVTVEIRTDGFDFPRDVRLSVRVFTKDAPKVRYLVERSAASVPFGPEGDVSIELVVEHGADRSEVVGWQHEFRFPAEPTVTRWALEVSEADCRAALRKLRAVR